MKIQCSYSGIQYDVPLFSTVLIPEGETVHPIFSLTTENLNDLYTEYLIGALSPQESYLVFLTMLNNTRLILWRRPIDINSIHPDKLTRIIATYFQPLFSISTKLAACKHPNFLAPSVVISEENNDLDNVKEWIKLWETAYSDFVSGLSHSQFLDSLRKKEAALAKFIKSPQIPAEKYAHVLADWACLAASFPPICAPDWKDLIIKCYKFEEIITKDQCDLEDLIAHCESNINEYSTGSILSHALFTCLSEGLGKMQDFYGAKSSNSAGFTQLDDSIPEQAIMLKMIESSAIEEPQQKDYQTKFEFIKAKMAWNAAQKYAEKAVLVKKPFDPVENNNELTGEL